MKKSCISKGILNGTLGLILAFAMTFQHSDILFADAERSDNATTIRFEKAEGTVSVKTGGMAEKSLSEKMNLYSGDHVITADLSYAWMSIDDINTIKLDEESESEIRENKKKSDVLLSRGSLFFNVTKSLSDDKSLNIRTSTVNAQIHEASGWMRIIDGLTTRVYVLEGKIDCLVSNPASGTTKTITVKSGEYADLRTYRSDTLGAKCDISVDRYIGEDIEGYILAELVGNDGTIREIYDDSGIDLRGFTPNDVEDRLLQDHEKSNNIRTQINAELNAQQSFVSTLTLPGRSSEDTAAGNLPEETSAGSEGKDDIELKKDNLDNKDNENKQERQDNTRSADQNITISNDAVDNRNESTVKTAKSGTDTVQGADRKNSPVQPNASDSADSSDNSGSSEDATSGYTVSISGNIKNGTVTAGKTVADYGTTVILTVTPNTSHKLKAGSVRVYTASGRALSVTQASLGKYTFTMPAEAVSVTAEFEYDGAYALAATWYKDAGDVKFKIGDEYVTSANSGDVVFVETKPTTGYESSVSPTDTCSAQSGTPVTILRNAAEGVWYFLMPARDVKDIEVIFTNAGTDHYQITENYLPAGTNVRLSINATPLISQSPAGTYIPGSKIILDGPSTHDVNDLSVTCGGKTLGLYDIAGNSRFRKYFYMPRGDVSISAAFTPKTYNITYNLNAGGDSTAKINDASIATTGTYGTAVTLPTNVTRSEYRFAGWYTSAEPDANDVPLNSVSSDNTDDITLYACWYKIITLSLPQEPEDIQDKLNDPDYVEVILAPGNASNTFGLSEQLSVPEGKTLTVSEGVTVMINADGSILNKDGGTLNNSGIIYIEEEYGIENGENTNSSVGSARMINGGYLFLNSWEAIVTTHGNIANNGTIYYSTGSTILQSGGGNAPEDGILVLDMGRAGDAIFIRTRIDATSNYKLDFFGNGEIGQHDNEYTNAPYINGQEKEYITVLEIHEGITKVGKNAFNVHLGGTDYYGFTSVILPDTLKEIGDYAFYNLIRPETISIPDSVTTIGIFAFARQQDKEDHTSSITLPASLESLGKYAFGYRSVITSVEIPGSVEIISEGAFKGCTSLRTVTINEGVKEIGKEAFCSCTSLTAIELPSGLETIGEKAYSGCTGVSQPISLPDSITTIEDDAFTDVPSQYLPN